MKTKKLLTLMFVMVLCAMLTVFASAKVEITVGSATYTAQTTAQTIDIPVTLSGNAEGILGLAIQVSYTDGVTIQSVSKGNALSTLTYQQGGDLTANPFNISWDGEEATTSNGILATVKFAIPKDSTKDFFIDVKVKNVYDNDMNDLEYTVTNGKIELKKQDMKNVSFKSATTVFNGETQTIFVTGAPTGATVAYTVDGQAFSGARNVGTYDIKAVVTCAGYNDKTLNATLTINPKELTVKNLKVSDKEYDGTTKADWTGEVVGFIPNTTDVKKHELRVEFDEASANTNAYYSVNLSMSGDYVMNYKFTPFKRTAKITPKVITVTADAKDKVVGELDPELTYTYTPELIGDDEFTGKLDRVKGEVGDKTYAITQGNLALNSNYKIVFVPAVLTINTKLIQNITVSEITDKTYGDEGFKVTATPDETSKLDAFTFSSSNENVATIDAEGNVVIKNAGTTVITVTEAGDDTYAKFEKKQTLNVKKVPITVTAKSYTVKIGKPAPALEYDYEGTLVGDDAFTGELERVEGDAVGTYDINIGSLTLGNNYEITFIKGVYTIIEKDPQDITIEAIADKTYGDEAFDIVITYGDLVNAESATSFTSLDSDVVTVDENGKVTIVAAGAASIKIERAGNADLADFAQTVTFNVNKKDVTITAVNLDDKTATLEGVIEGDNVTADLTNIVLEKGEAVDDTTVNVTVKGIVLIGASAANYNLATLEAAATIANDKIATVTVIAENGTVEGAGTYIKLATITLTATPKRGYRFDGWYIGEDKQSGDKEISFTIDSDIELIAKFKVDYSDDEVIVVTPTHTVKFISNGSEYAVERVLDGGKVKELMAPKSEGAEFIGWYLDTAFTTPYTFDTAIKSDLTVYAKWSDSVPTEPETPAEPETPDTEWTNPYIDIKSDDWFYESVAAATKQGLMNGMSENEFAPNATLSRAMLATILYRLAGSPEVEAEAKFTDVAVGTWYAKAVTWAAANGIVNGMENNKFAPDANITREQMATMLYRYAAYAKLDTAVSEDKTAAYADVAKISSYATDAFKWAVANGIINGDTATTLSPEKNATRSQATALIVRFSELVK